MFGRKKRAQARGTVDGGEGRGVPLGGKDDRPPTGYDSRNDDNDFDDLLWEEGDAADRRKDPLRRPLSS